MEFLKVTRRRRCVPHGVFKSCLMFSKVTRRRCCVPHVVSKNCLMFLKVICYFQNLLAGGTVYHMLFLKVTRRRRCVPHDISTVTWKLLYFGAAFHISFSKCIIENILLIVYYNIPTPSKSLLSYPLKILLYVITIFKLKIWT